MHIKHYAWTKAETEYIYQILKREKNEQPFLTSNNPKQRKENVILIIITGQFETTKSPSHWNSGVYIWNLSHWPKPAAVSPALASCIISSFTREPTRTSSAGSSGRNIRLLKTLSHEQTLKHSDVTAHERCSHTCTLLCSGSWKPIVLLCVRKSQQRILRLSKVRVKKEEGGYVPCLVGESDREKKWIFDPPPLREHSDKYSGAGKARRAPFHRASRRHASQVEHERGRTWQTWK